MRCDDSAARIYRPDVWTSHPIEPDAYQGFSSDCNLNWLGSTVPLRWGSLALLCCTLALPCIRSLFPMFMNVHCQTEDLSPIEWCDLSHGGCRNVSSACVPRTTCAHVC